MNPPYDRAGHADEQFMMNLPESLQREKLDALVDTIASRFAEPRVFKAGRYGLGRRNGAHARTAWVSVDTSVCPRHDFREMGGPSFAAFDSSPFLLTDRLMEVPCTVDYTGWIGAPRAALHAAASRDGAAASAGRRRARKDRRGQPDDAVAGRQHLRGNVSAVDVAGPEGCRVLHALVP